MEQHGRCTALSLTVTLTPLLHFFHSVAPKSERFASGQMVWWVQGLLVSGQTGLWGPIGITRINTEELNYSRLDRQIPDQHPFEAVPHSQEPKSHLSSYLHAYTRNHSTDGYQ